MMYTALSIDLCFVRSRCICELRALYDMEVVVCCVAAGVPFGANCSTYVGVSIDEAAKGKRRRTKYDEIFRDACDCDVSPSSSF
jgi:hypothetical protein